MRFRLAATWHLLSDALRTMKLALALLLVASAAAEESCNATKTGVVSKIKSWFGAARPKPVLRYFNIRGRGEPIRMAMADAGIEFEDATFAFDEWGKESAYGLKANWTKEGRLAFGQVPLLEIDGLQLVQSHTILRYLGRKLKWYTGDKATLAKIDMISEGVEDVTRMLGAIRYMNATAMEKHEAAVKYFQEPDKAPRWIEGYFEKVSDRRSRTIGRCRASPSSVLGSRRLTGSSRWTDCGRE